MTDRPAVDKNLAKDVAKHLDRRQRRRKILLYGGLAAAIVLAVLYGTCGGGWGLGKGSGSGDGARPAMSTSDAGPRRCTVKVAAGGITVDGTAATRDEAVARCKATTGADVTVTNGARHGDWEDLRAALTAAGVEIFTRDPAVPPAHGSK